MTVPARLELSTNRNGFLAPVVALALLGVMLCMALVLDRFRLESARGELTKAAEAAALAAGRELVTDDLLRPEVDREKRLAEARRAAVDIAAQNRVAGQPLRLDRPFGDVRFGQFIRPAGMRGHRFLETEVRPDTVLVTAARTRSRNNPVALVYGQLTGQPSGDVAVRVAAEIDNHVIGLRPFDGVPVPVLPLAILKRDPTGECSRTWATQIEQRGGADRHAWDETAREVHAEPDGIPEIVLRTRSNGDNPANAVWVDPRAGFRRDDLLRHIVRGWSAEDLNPYGREFRMDRGPIELRGTPHAPRDARSALSQVIGRCRIGLLFVPTESDDPAGPRSIRCVGLVAGRVLAVRSGASEAIAIVFQPGVMTTRTALLAESPGPGVRNVAPNPYLYKLFLSH